MNIRPLLAVLLSLCIVTCKPKNSFSALELLPDRQTSSVAAQDRAVPALDARTQVQELNMTIFAPLPITQLPVVINQQEVLVVPEQITESSLADLARRYPHLERLVVLSTTAIGSQQELIIRRYFPQVTLTQAQAISVRREHITREYITWFMIMTRLFNLFIILDIHEEFLTSEECILLRSHLPSTPLFLIRERQRIPASSLAFNPTTNTLQ